MPPNLVIPRFYRIFVGLLTPAHERFGEKMPRAERYADKLQPFSALLALPIFALFATATSDNVSRQRV